MRCINVRGVLYFNGERSLDEFRLIEVWYIGELFLIDFFFGLWWEKLKDFKFFEEISVFVNSICECEKVEKN